MNRFNLKQHIKLYKNLPLFFYSKYFYSLGNLKCSSGFRNISDYLLIAFPRYLDSNFDYIDPKSYLKAVKVDILYSEDLEKYIADQHTADRPVNRSKRPHKYPDCRTSNHGIVKHLSDMEVRDRTEGALLMQLTFQPYCIGETMLRALFFIWEYQGKEFKPKETYNWVTKTKKNTVSYGFLNLLIRLKLMYVIDYQVKKKGREIYLTVNFTEDFKSFVKKTNKGNWSKIAVCKTLMEPFYHIRALVKMIIDSEAKRGLIGTLLLPEHEEGGFQVKFVPKTVNVFDFWNRFIVGATPSFHPIFYRLLWKNDEKFRAAPFPVRNVGVEYFIRFFKGRGIRELCETGMRSFTEFCERIVKMQIHWDLFACEAYKQQFIKKKYEDIPEVIEACEELASKEENYPALTIFWYEWAVTKKEFDRIAKRKNRIKKQVENYKGDYKELLFLEPVIHSRRFSRFGLYKILSIENSLELICKAYCEFLEDILLQFRNWIYGLATLAAGKYEDFVIDDMNTRLGSTFHKRWITFFGGWFKYPKGEIWFRTYVEPAARELDIAISMGG